MANADDLLVVLKSIDGTLKELLTLSKSKRAATPQPAESVASDATLDGQYGNPVVKAKDPREWTGDSMNGKPLSECPPEYLDLLAARYDYFNTTLTATDAETVKKRGYNARDAALCRGWARRKRAGWTPPQASNPWEA